MKRYMITLIFTVSVVSLYYFIDLRFFDLDLNKMVKNSLFEFRTNYVDNSIIIYNVSDLQQNVLKERIDSILLAEPKIIGINLCHFTEIPNDLIATYKDDNRVIFASCSNGPGSLNRIINENNVVTHFNADRDDYFESQLTSFSGRGNDAERINYGIQFYIRELQNDNWLFSQAVIEDKIVLLGYLGRIYSPDMINDYTSTRITPLNEYYGEVSLSPDMYDVEISATIIAMISNDEMINEFSQWLRVLILLACCLINVILLTFTRTRWLMLNLTIATILFLGLTLTGSFLMVYLFIGGYFVELDELPYMLVATTVFTVGLDVFKN